MIQPIILAAGKGTRMRSENPKALAEVGGISMLGRLLKTFATVEMKKPLIVVGWGAEHIKKQFPDERFVAQTEQNGTAGAVSVCIPSLVPDDEAVFVLYVDNPFITKQSVEDIRTLFAQEKPAIVLGTTTVPDFSDWREAFLFFGRIVRGEGGELERIVEYKNATEQERAITEINPGFYCIDSAWLKEALPRVKPNPVSGELYLTDIIALAKTDGRRILTVAVSAEESLGVNSPEDALRAEEVTGNLNQ